MNSKVAAEELLRRKIARNCLEGFIKYIKPEFSWSAHHHLICKSLDELIKKTESKEGERLMIFAPPRHSKSEIVSRLFPAYILGRNPDWQIISTSYNDDFAQDFGREVREIVRQPEFTTLFKGFGLKADSQAVNKWRTNEGGIYVTAGVGGSITGRGAHIAIIDDPIKSWEEAKSKVVRDRIYNWYMTVLRTRLMPGGSIVLMHTRWEQDDLAGRLLRDQENDGEKWKVISLPAFSKGKEVDILGREEGEELWKEWYPAPSLLSLKRALPPYQWSALYQQEPIDEESALFSREWFSLYDKIDEDYKVVICADFAVSKDAGDYTEIGVFGLSNEKIYVLDWWSGRETPDVWISHLVTLMRRWSPYCFVGEAGQIRRSVEPFIHQAMLEAGIYCRMEWLPSSKSKEARLQSFIGLSAQNKVCFPKGVGWANRVLEQLFEFTGAEGKRDDAVDVCSLLGRIYPQIPLYFSSKAEEDVSTSETQYLRAGW